MLGADDADTEDAAKESYLPKSGLIIRKGRGFWNKARIWKLRSALRLQ